MEKPVSDLIVWNKAIDLAEMIYKVTQRFPKNEEFGLKSQMRRAAVSVPSNIAEGSARSTPRDFTQFLRVSKGSLRELETHLVISFRIGYLDENSANPLFTQIEEVSRLLTGLIASQTSKMVSKL